MPGSREHRPHPHRTGAWRDGPPRSRSTARSLEIPRIRLPGIACKIRRKELPFQLMSSRILTGSIIIVYVSPPSIPYNTHSYPMQEPPPARPPKKGFLYTPRTHRSLSCHATFFILPPQRINLPLQRIQVREDIHLRSWIDRFVYFRHRLFRHARPEDAHAVPAGVAMDAWRVSAPATASSCPWRRRWRCRAVILVLCGDAAAHSFEAVDARRPSRRGISRRRRGWCELYRCCVRLFRDGHLACRV